MKISNLHVTVLLLLLIGWEFAWKHELVDRQRDKICEWDQPYAGEEEAAQQVNQRFTDRGKKRHTP